MKSLFICMILLVVVSNLKAQKETTKFRTLFTSSSEKISGEWTEWKTSTDGENILVVRDFDNNKISTYGDAEKHLSIITWDKEIKSRGYIMYGYECVDEKNVKCNAYMLYPQEEGLDILLVIQYTSYRFRFGLKRE